MQTVSLAQHPQGGQVTTKDLVATSVVLEPGDNHASCVPHTTGPHVRTSNRRQLDNDVEKPSTALFVMPGLTSGANVTAGCMRRVWRLQAADAVADQYYPLDVPRRKITTKKDHRLIILNIVSGLAYLDGAAAADVTC